MSWLSAPALPLYFGGFAFKRLKRTSMSVCSCLWTILDALHPAILLRKICIQRKYCKTGCLPVCLLLLLSTSDGSALEFYFQLCYVCCFSSPLPRKACSQSSSRKLMSACFPLCPRSLALHLTSLLHRSKGCLLSLSALKNLHLKFAVNYSMALCSCFSPPSWKLCTLKI